MADSRWRELEKRGYYSKLTERVDATQLLSYLPCMLPYNKEKVTQRHKNDGRTEGVMELLAQLRTRRQGFDNLISALHCVHLHDLAAGITGEEPGPCSCATSAQREARSVPAVSSTTGASRQQSISLINCNNVQIGHGNTQHINGCEEDKDDGDETDLGAGWLGPDSHDTKVKTVCDSSCNQRTTAWQPPEDSFLEQTVPKEYASSPASIDTAKRVYNHMRDELGVMSRDDPNAAPVNTTNNARHMQARDGAQDGNDLNAVSSQNGSERPEDSLNIQQSLVENDVNITSAAPPITTRCSEATSFIDQGKSENKEDTLEVKKNLMTSFLRKPFEDKKMPFLSWVYIGTVVIAAVITGVVIKMKKT